MHQLKMVTHACMHAGRESGRGKRKGRRKGKRGGEGRKGREGRGKGKEKRKERERGEGKEEEREERGGSVKEYTSTRHTYTCMYNYANNNMQISHHLSLFPGREGEENSNFPPPIQPEHTIPNMFPINRVSGNKI